MKALFTLLFIAFFGLPNAFSQVAKAPETTVPVAKAGVKGGVNIASVSNLVGSSAFLGYHAGFFGEIPLQESFGIGGEFLYSKQGVTASYLDFNLNYLTLPVFVNVYDGNFTFQGGLYGAAMFMATTIIGQEKKDITDNFKTTDHGILVGITYSPWEPTFICLRFNLGLQNINKSFTKDSDAVLRNRNLQVSAGYQF